MDWHKLQHTLFKLDPTDPREDLAKLQQSAGKPADNIPTIDYINESVEVPSGSMPLNIDNVSDFARLAGIQTKQIVNEENDDTKKKSSFGQNFAKGFQAVQKGGALGPDAVSNIVGKALTPGDSDKNKTSNQTNKIPRGLVDKNREKDLAAAIALINQNQSVTDVNQQRALAAAFRTLLNNPQQASKLLTSLKDSIDHNTVKTPIETVVKKEYGSIKEELYKMLNAKK
jgi:hypothetical protein